MKSPILHQSGFVCRSCREARHSLSLTVQLSTRASLCTNITLSPSKVAALERGRPNQSFSLRRSQAPSPYSTRWLSTAPAKANASSPSGALEQLIADSEQIRLSTTIPDEADVLKILESSQELSELLINGDTYQSDCGSAEPRSIDTPTSAILGLDEPAGERKRKLVQTGGSLSQQSAALAKNLRDLLADAKVYISPAMLAAYVSIQVTFGKPEYLPEIFHLYAQKPIARSSNPSPSSSTNVANPSQQGRRFIPTSPRSPKNAIPLALATRALTSAISLKSLPLALSIIESTVTAPAFRINKVLRQASLPLTFLSMTPFCAYTISSYIGHEYQTSHDPVTATWFCMAGIMAYVGTAATMGFAALTTHNDQMMRVVWQPGTPLRDRWLKEEERAAFDRLALSWGFRERWRWGEERGEDWDALREFCARRGMILDKSDLLDGMK